MMCPIKACEFDLLNNNNSVENRVRYKIYIDFNKYY